jgi:hypothetical protein
VRLPWKRKPAPLPPSAPLPPYAGARYDKVTDITGSVLILDGQQGHGGGGQGSHPGGRSGCPFCRIGGHVHTCTPELGCFTYRFRQESKP